MEEQNSVIPLKQQIDTVRTANDGSNGVDGPLVGMNQIQPAGVQPEQKHSIKSVIKKVSEMPATFISQTPIQFYSDETFKLTANNQVVSACSEGNYIYVWDLQTKEYKHKIFVDSYISAMHVSKKNIQYLFYLYNLETIQIRSASNLKVIKSIKNLGEDVSDILSDEETFAIVALTINGIKEIRYYPYTEDEILTTFQNFPIDEALKRSTTSKRFFLQMTDNYRKLVAAIQDSIHIIKIWNTRNQKLVGTHKLHLLNSMYALRCCFLSFDGQYVFLRDKGKRGVKIVSTTNGKVISKIKDIDNSNQLVMHIFVTNNNEKIITQIGSQFVYAHNLHTKKELYKRTYSKVFALFLHEIDQYLFVSHDKNVSIIQTSNFQELYSIHATLDVLNLTFQVSQDLQFIVYKDKEKIEFISLEHQQNKQKKNIFVNSEKIESNCSITYNNEYILIHMVVFTNVFQVKSQSFQKPILFPNTAPKFAVCNKGQFMFYQLPYCVMNKYDLTKEQVVESYDYRSSDYKVEKVFSNFILSSDDNLLICAINTSSIQRLEIFDLNTKQFTHAFKDQEFKTFEYMFFSKNEQYLVQLDFKQQYLISDLVEKTVKRYNEATETQVTFTLKFYHKTENNLIIGFQDKNIIIYDIEQQKITMSIKKHNYPIIELNMTVDEKYFISKSKEEFIIWNFDTYKQELKISSKNIVLLLNGRSQVQGLIINQIFRPFNDELYQELFLQDHENITPTTFQEMQIYNQEIYFKGTFTNIFPGLLSQLKIDDNMIIQELIPSLKSYEIMPYKINMLHIFAYKGDPECLKEILRMGIPYQKDIFCMTPLQYALKKRSQKCVELIISYIQTKPEIIEQLCEQEILETIDISPANLSQLYLFSLKTQHIHKLQYGTLKGDKVQFLLSPEQQLNIDQAQKMVNTSNKEQVKQLLTFCSTQFKYNFVVGSQSSINFHQSLENTSHDNIFVCDLIQSIFAYKWRQIQHIIWIQGLFLLSFIIFVAIYQAQARENLPMNYAFLAYSIVFFLIEVYQFVCSYRDYFVDFWNVIDCLRTIIGSVYCIAMIRNIYDAEEFNSSQDESSGYEYPEYLPILLAITNFFSWMRLIAFLRLFKQTRAFIRLIQEVGKDMAAFAIIMTLFVFCFAITLQILLQPTDDSGADFNFEESLKTTYRTLYGDFNVDDYSRPQWVLFIISSILMPLIMMNLLIAIMSETFNKVTEGFIIADGREMNSLILEHERLYFWNRRKSESKFLHWVNYDSEVQYQKDEILMEQEKQEGKKLQIIQDINEENEEIDANENPIKIEQLTIKIEDIEKHISHLQNDVKEILQFHKTKQEIKSD